MNGLIKICGITDHAGMVSSLHHGADMIGFVFRKNSSRHIALAQAAELRNIARGKSLIAAVMVNPDDDFLSALQKTVDPDVLQLHGHETPRRAAEISAKFEKPVIKALGIGSMNDLAALGAFEQICDHILVEARNSEGAACGGHGRIFDWNLLRSLKRTDHLLLAGGLDAQNVGDAIALTHVGGVDVSSGVEYAPGLKDDEKIGHFIRAARAAFAKQPQKVFA